MDAYGKTYERIITVIKETHNEINALENGASGVIANAIWGVRVALNAVEWAVHGLLKALEILENEEKSEGKEKSG